MLMDMVELFYTSYPTQYTVEVRTERRELAVRATFWIFWMSGLFGLYTVFQLDFAWSQRPSRACWAILPDDRP